MKNGDFPISFLYVYQRLSSTHWSYMGARLFFINQQVEREPKEPDFAQNQASPETKKSNPPKTAWWF